MKGSASVIELPVSATKDVDGLVRWFEKKRVYDIEHPVISISEKDESRKLILIGLYLVIGIALLKLEEKGKIKVSSSMKDKSPNDFLILLKNSKSEDSLEKLIEKRYNMEFSIQSSKNITTDFSKQDAYSLNDIFGIWKGRGRSLEKERQAQWGRRK